MPYTKTTWQDNITPLSAANMNNLETQYDAVKAELGDNTGELWAQIKAADGAGSGLDADMVDGMHGVTFLKMAFPSMFSGADGDVIISSDTTLTNPVYCYNNLTIDSGTVLTANNNTIISVKNTLTLNGTISVSGKGQTGGTLIGTSGGAGGGSLIILANNIVGNGAIKADGIDGDDGVIPTEGARSYNQAGSIGSFYGFSHSTFNTGGTYATGPCEGNETDDRIASLFKALYFFDILDSAANKGASGGCSGCYAYDYSVTGGPGGGGGAGAAGNGGDCDQTNTTYSTSTGCSGSGGGGGGSIILVSLNAVPAITVSAKGGNGGDAVRSAGSAPFGGGGGGGGGIVVIVAPSSSANINVAGGDPGTGIGSGVTSAAGEAGISVFLPIV